MIHPMVSIIPAYKGTITVHNDAFDQSATVQFKDSSTWRSMTGRKGDKNGVSLTRFCKHMASLAQRSCEDSLARLPDE